MNTNELKMKRMLWLEDQYTDLVDYSSRLSRIDFLVEPVNSVTQALEKMKSNGYEAYVLDLKTLPGDDPYWQNLDDRKRQDNPNFDPYLGLELLRFLNKARENKEPFWEEIKFDFNKVIVFSVVNDKNIFDELTSFGIPQKQIVYKSGINLDTLPKLVMQIREEKVGTTNE